MNEFVAAAIEGRTPVDRLTFAANKVYKKEGNTISDIRGTVGEIFSMLAAVNRNLWRAGKCLRLREDSA